MKKAPVEALTGVLLTGTSIPRDEGLVQTNLRFPAEISNTNEDVCHIQFRGSELGCL